MGLSNLGIFHTVIGIIALVAGIVSLVKTGKIDLHYLSGRIYFYSTLITSFTALGLSRKGGFNAGHVFSLFIVVLIAVAYYLHKKRADKKRARYTENFLFSFSFFLSLVPTVNETFTRVPVRHPLAHDPADPLIAKTLGVLLILFTVGAVLQFRRQVKVNRMM